MSIRNDSLIKEILWGALWVAVFISFCALIARADTLCSGSGFRTQEYTILGDATPVFTISIADKTTCDGKVGMVAASTGLNISIRPDNVTFPTVYTSLAATIETIPTLGSYTQPTNRKVRFREVDPLNQRGVYEIQVARSLLSVTGSKRLDVCVSGAADIPKATCMKVYLEKSSSCGSHC